MHIHSRLLNAFRGTAAKLSVLLAALPTGAAHTQVPKSPAERLAESTALSTLDVSGLRPYHLLLNVTLYDSAGDNPRTGTIEYWHRDADSLTVMKFGDATRTMLQVAGKGYRSASGSALPSEVDAVLQAVLHPGPDLEDIKNSIPQLHRDTFSKAPIDCVVLTQPIKGIVQPPPGLFPGYCLLHDSLRLVISYEPGTRAVTRNRVGKFLERDVTLKLSIQERHIVVANAEVATLVTFQPQHEFEPRPEMEKDSVVPVVVSGGVIAANRLSGPPPDYPTMAVIKGAAGTVTMRAILNREGQIRFLSPMVVPNADLGLAAVTAVRHWVYKPYLLNGIPTEVDTTIAVNFDIGAY